MKLSSLVFGLVGMAIGIVVTITISGCHTVINFKYDPAIDALSPVVKSGDVIHWSVPITWWSEDEGPCDAAEFTKSNHQTCIIRTAVKQTEYSYKCPTGEYCDPDVVVDDEYKPLIPAQPPPATPLAAGVTAAADPTDPNIFLECRPNGVTIKPSLDKNDRKQGETVRWRSTGGFELADGWKVVLQGANADTFCGGKKEFDESDGECTLALATGNYVDYAVTTTCSPTQAGKVTVK